MRMLSLGKTGIVTPKNAFGALPIQRISKEEAVKLVRKAFEGGMTFFDTARAYTDSEEKLGEAFQGIRDRVYIASKTAAKTPEDFWNDLRTTLTNLQTDHLDLYQLHCVKQCYKPGDGTGMYEALLEAKEKGYVRHIGITAHLIAVAEEIVRSGLYETLQFPLSYLSADRDLKLMEDAVERGMGFIAMKGLAGGLLTNSRACMAFMNTVPALPIWGIQRESELSEWLSYMKEDVEMTDEIKEIILRDKAALAGDFCRGCGYCMPCTVGIAINQCARMSQMVRRAPKEEWLSEHWQAEMEKIDDCIECGLCASRCPYELNTPELLKKNLADYRSILRGETII